MSQQLVEEVDRSKPVLLQMNLGATCHEFTRLVIARLRAEGHQAFHVCKTQGEGQYIPPGFGRVVVAGLDGNGHTVVGVSHDAIWCDGLQFDTVVGGNEHDRPIYRRNGDPNWSFDPNDGPQIIGRPTWNSIPRVNWRNNNPPLPKDLESRLSGGGGGSTTPVPPPQKPQLTVPDYASMGDDAFFVDKVGAFVEEEMANSPEKHMNKGSASWIARAVHGAMERFVINGDHRDADAIAKKVRNEMRAVLGKPPLP